MPWTKKDVEEHVKGLSDKQSEAWVAIANKSRDTCMADSGDEEECDAQAIRTANAMSKNVKEDGGADWEGLTSLLREGEPLAEDATTKSLALRLSRDLSSLLADREVPAGLRKAAETLHAALKGAKWADLAARAKKGRKSVKPADQADSQDEPETEEAPDAPGEEGASAAAAEADKPVKTVGGVGYGAEDFLVIPDPESPSTWALQVRKHGQPDHGLMGAAYAALTVGFRGNKYEGPDKGKAMTALKELYAAEEMTWPGETKEAEVEEQAQEPLAESISGVELLSEGDVPADAQGPLTLKVQLIRPGLGNQKDNHYYSAEMLRRCADRFTGAKMFETDHRPGEKSTRTWVSTVRKIAGFAHDGAPIAEVTVHDPNFAQRVRNLHKEGLLNRMECSILGDGKTHMGEVEGKRVKVVDDILEVSSVDWVTKAGAGGKVLEIAESGQDYQDEVDMTKDEIKALVKEVLAEVAAEQTEQAKIAEAEAKPKEEQQPKPEPKVTGLGERKEKPKTTLSEKDEKPLWQRQAAIVEKWVRG